MNKRTIIVVDSALEPGHEARTALAKAALRRYGVEAVSPESLLETDREGAARIVASAEAVAYTDQARLADDSMPVLVELAKLGCRMLPLSAALRGLAGEKEAGDGRG